MSEEEGRKVGEEQAYLCCVPRTRPVRSTYVTNPITAAERLVQWSADSETTHQGCTNLES